MTTATVATIMSKQPYTDNYGTGIEINFYSEQIGDYKRKIRNDDARNQWVTQLQDGKKVELVKNTKGKGYFINQLNEETTEQIFNSLGEENNQPPPQPVQVNTSSMNNFLSESVKKKSDLMTECYVSMKTSLNSRGLINDLTSEDIRCMAISLFIQLERNS